MSRPHRVCDTRPAWSSAPCRVHCSAIVPNVNAVRAAHDRARAEPTSQITTVAHRHLAADGVAGLSLRAIARELGMVSSAITAIFGWVSFELFGQFRNGIEDLDLAYDHRVRLLARFLGLNDPIPPGQTSDNQWPTAT